MSHLADSTFIKAFGTDTPHDPHGDHAMDIEVTNDNYAVVYACIPPYWDVQKFIATINKAVKEVIGSDLFYPSQSEADLANLAEGADAKNFTDLEVTFRKG